jgi:hypothetical protein
MQSKPRLRVWSDIDRRDWSDIDRRDWSDWTGLERLELDFH